jgi:signal peptidase II
VLGEKFLSTHLKRIYLLAGLVWLADLSTKVWAQNNLSTSQPIKVIGNLLRLTFVRNPGAAFSFAEGATIFFSLFALLVFVGIIYFSPRITSRGWSWVLGLVLGGVLGNLTDRVFRAPGFLRGHVIDWIELPKWPIFNLADSAIVVAAGIAIVLSIRNIPPITANRESS